MSGWKYVHERMHIVSQRPQQVWGVGRLGFFCGCCLLFLIFGKKLALFVTLSPYLSYAILATTVAIPRELGLVPPTMIINHRA